MKRHIKILILLSLVTIASWYLPMYYDYFYIFKHTISFILVAYVVILIVYKINRGLLLRLKKKIFGRKTIVVNIISVLIVVGIFIGVRVQQLEYIDEYETPPIVRCFYYDDYGNFIHSSRMKYTCPTMDILEKSSDQLHVELSYKYPGEPLNQYTMVSPNVYKRVDEGYGVVDITLRYDNDQNITYYHYKEAVQYIEKYYEKENGVVVSSDKKYTAGEVIIESNYGDDDVIQEKNVYELSNKLVSFNDVEELDYYDFDLSLPNYSSQYIVNFESDVDLDVRNAAIKITLIEDSVNIDDFYQGYLEKKGHFLDIVLEQENNQEIYSYNLHSQVGSSYDIVKDGVNDVYRYIKVEDHPFYLLYKKITTENDVSFIYKDTELVRLKEYMILYDEGALYEVKSTEFGYIIEQYEEDGFKTGERFNVDTFELENGLKGYDYLVIDYFTPTNMMYQSDPILVTNPLIVYLIKEYKE